MPDLEVRRLSGAASDRQRWRAVCELCCRTGENGAPIAPERWEFFARVWIEPYRKLLPEWTYVAEIDGVIAGYLTGCPDTSSFNAGKRWRSTLPLLGAIMAGRYRNVAGTGAFLRRNLGFLPSVEDCFSRSLRRTLSREYPAHLHMNVDARYRRTGIGRQLMERYVFDLAAEGVPGVHLVCGPDPVQFYRRLGFEPLEQAQTYGMAVFAMVKRCPVKFS
jgi:GNAT superfamily N-acetyltransferase